jgi:AraC-like DNA-binding protein
MLRFVLHSLGELGADRTRLARDAGLPVWALPDDSVRLDLDQLVKLWSMGRAICGPDVGLQVAALWSRGALHLVDYLHATAPTLRDGLRRFANYRSLAVRNSANRLEVADHSDGLELRFLVRSGDEMVDGIATQFGLAIVRQLCRHALGRPIRPVSISLPESPEFPRDRLVEGLGTAAITYGTEHASMVLARDDADSVLPTADPVLARILGAQADSLIGPEGARSGWIEEVRLALASHSPGPHASLATIARSLAVSPRTLQRRLDEAGTSWTVELDHARRQIAIRLLRQGRGREEIAASLGYSDVRSLRRALQRWSRQELFSSPHY